MDGRIVRGTRAVELSLFPLIILMRKHNLGDPHPLFAGGRRYVSPRFADEAERLVLHELTNAGLGDDDALRDFTDMLLLVQRATTEYYGWMSSGEHKYAVLTAVLGRRAVAVTRAGDRVTFERIAANEALEELVYRLPDARGADGVPISVSASELEQNRNGNTAPQTGDSTRQLDALFREPRLGGAKLYVASRDEAGTRHRSENWLTLLDLIAGRWLIYPTRRHGDQVVNAVPGGPQVISARLSDLRRSLP